MLEIDQARRYRDLALEVEVDLSAVSHFATANSVESIPAPVRDRMRILTMPDPGWQHLGTLTRQIVDRIAGERGVDPRFFGALAEDEMELIRQAWPGGSIRKLTRIVATILDGRDRILGRC
jgi:ATP-dependent Lon protease